jgi:hypothetical protein
MPNDCYNYLEVSNGDVSLIADYISVQKDEWSSLPDTFLDFQKIIPMPKKLRKTNFPNDQPNWHSWRMENWGTRSNSYEGIVLERGMGFSTAWSPPIKAIVALAKKVGHALSLTYDEPGMDFCGNMVATPDGRYVDTCYSPRRDAPEDLKERLGIENEDEELG